MNISNQTEREVYLQKKYDYIPISAQLIDHVRRIDGFDDSQLSTLKKLLVQCAQKHEKQFSFNDKQYRENLLFSNFLEITLKIHQIFALVDVDYQYVFPSIQFQIRAQNLLTHFHQVADELSDNNGLNYLPRERSVDGRLFEHAADSKVLIHHLYDLDDSQIQQKNVVTQQGDVTFYVKLIDEAPQVALKEGKPLVEDQNYIEELKLAEKFQPKIHEDLKIKNENIVLFVNKAFISMTMKAHGKADLYFHAYFWEKYLKSLQDAQGKVNLKQNKSKGQTKKTTDDDLPNTQNDQENSEELGPIDIFSDQYPFIKRILGLSLTLTKVIVNIKKFPFNEKTYQKYVNELGKREITKKLKYLEEIQRALFVAQIANDKEGLHWIEKLLIQLQGYCDISIRDQAIVLLNMLYDGVDWQLQEAFRPIIRSVGQHFIIKVIVHKISNFQDSQIFLGLGAPSPILGNNSHLLTWHKIDQRNIQREDNVQIEIDLNFGKFWKCGFYDWRLVSINEEGKLSPLEIIGKPEPVFPHHTETHDDYYEQNEDEEAGSIAQGRFIVHAKGIKEHSFHEIQVDHQNARVDKAENRYIQRGTFKDVEMSIQNYQKQGISALYLMGTLERDNYPVLNKYTNGLEYRKEDASPLATIDRSTPNKMLGGEADLQKLMKRAKENKVKIIVDCLARISSSRHHRKYNSLLLRYLDQDGRRHICYGTDGQAQKFEDTAMLNYRKQEAWEMLIEEIVQYSKKFDFDGIHLDNGQAWPQIMEPDIDELSRIDVDGVPVYTPEDFMNGEIVLRNENYGYWNSNNMESYPNPFFVKMCKRLWFENSDFIIAGECWGGFMFENRQIILARSGVIPRLFKLPVVISSLFGKKLHKDGRIESCNRENALAIKKWHEDSRKYLPEGTIQIQSSTSNCLPYPAFLYGKGTWAAIDILFFMPDLPITYSGEIDGEIYNVGGENLAVFQHEQSEISSNNPNELKRTNSQIMRALQESSIDSKADTSSQTLGTEERRGMPRVRSGINFAAEQIKESNERGLIIKKEQTIKQLMAPEQGFDLSKINTHYMHRRRLRKEKMVLRYGEVVHLTARDLDNNMLSDILCYARYALMETAIIATNLTDQNKKFYIDLSQLLPVFKKAYPNNTVVMIKNVISEDKEPDYFFLREFIELKTQKSLPAYRSLMISVTICQDDDFIFKKCLTNSIERTKRNLLAKKSIETEQISLLFSDCVEHNPSDIFRFANVIGSIQSSFLDKLSVSFRDLFTENKKLSQSVELSSRLIGMTRFLIQNAGGQVIAPIRAAQSIHDSNILGPIIFCSPELGRWSTVGGLGVMVDELAIGLAELGQDVYVISPYYERNRKGETGYLAKDPAGIHYRDNLHVGIGPGYTLGVHEGVVSGVKLVFLHNGDIFPSAYPDALPPFLVTQIAVFGKACLEYCCQRQIIPAICVTNDWFTGLTAAYAKIGHFGETFKGTTFLHICHNLQESYEGRIHLDPVHGDQGSTHQLPRDWLIDPQWKNIMINPSRCAIMLSDQWATVSKSYREDLLNSSSLSWLLRQKPQPFAFPNGIPIQERVKKLDQSAPDHKTAKKYLQQKYFGFQDLDDTVPLFAFVGRVTSQKGVHLILDIAEGIIQKFDYKVQFLVGGPANMKEPYSAGCAHKMWHLRTKYPHCFWAAPEEFFMDGSLVNRGADFGLMPSVFEPGGIVQHEFFVGGTPVVAFKTGGLKDSVIEYLWDTEIGCGYTFESHTIGDFVYAMERAIGTFRNKPKYAKLRENAFQATMDGEIVSKAWLAEFYRLRGKIFIDYTVIKDLEKQFQPWHPQDYTPISIIQEIFGSEKKEQIFQEIDHGATEGENQKSGENLMEIDNIMSAFDQIAFNKKPKAFGLPNRGPKYNSVEICGSFDDWQVRHEMSFDPFTNQWFATLHLKPGEEFLYKYIINGNNWVVNDEELKKSDGLGNINNCVNIQM